MNEQAPQLSAEAFKVRVDAIKAHHAGAVSVHEQEDGSFIVADEKGWNLAQGTLSELYDAAISGSQEGLEEETQEDAPEDIKVTEEEEILPKTAFNQ